MNYWLLASGIAALLLDLIHVFPGGKEIHRPMVSSELVAPLKAVWSVVWHGVTVVLAFGGIALITAAFSPNKPWPLPPYPSQCSLALPGFSLPTAFCGLERSGPCRNGRHFWSSLGWGWLE